MAEAGARVLVVDDERFFREAIREILEGDGFDCLEAGDGEKALALATDPSCGVVVLDIRLPGIDGIEVLRRMREQRPALRCLMLSASTDQELVLEALRLGACDYLAKPLHDEELVLAVRRAAESYAVATDWGRLRGRLDRLVERMEELAVRACRAGAEGREEVVCQGAAAAVAEVLEATKTSVMLLCEEAGELRVRAATGRSGPVDALDPVPIGEGVAGAALEGGRALLVREAHAELGPGGGAPPGRYETDSFALAPLELGERRLGLLCATDRAGGGTFGQEDVTLLRILALQIAEILTAAVPEGESAPSEPAWAEGGASASDLTVVLEPDVLDERAAGATHSAAADGDAELARLVCDAAVREVEPERVMRAVLAPLAAALPAAPVSLYLIDKTSGELVREGECDGGARSDRPELSRSEGLTAGVLRTGHLLATDHPESDLRFAPEFDTPEDGVAGPLLCVPLHLRGKVVGVFRAFLRDGGHASARTGEVLSAALSAAVRSVLLYRSLVETIEEVAEARRQAGQPG